MAVLNLIVHEELLQVFGDLYYPTLKRIDDVKKSGNTKSIHWDNMDFEIALNLSKGYDSVVLFGCSRYCCLSDTSEILYNSNISVSYDIDGTI